MARRLLASEDRYRGVSRDQIIDLLVMYGWAHEVRAGAREAARVEARAALERALAAGLPFRRSSAGEPMFDIAEAANFVEWTSLTGGDQTWERHCVATARRLVDESWIDGADPSPRTREPRRYAVTVRRTFNLEDRRPGERVRLRLPLPIEDSALGDVAVEILPPEAVAVEFATGPAHLDAVVAVPASRSVSIGIKVSFTARPTPPAAPGAALDAADAALYTRPSEGLIRVSARVAALAAALAGEETDRWAILRRFWTFMLDEMVCGAVRYDRLDRGRPLDSALDWGWCDCRVGSALLAALCRARAIPARVVSGYMLHPAAACFHTWMEAWIDGAGWIPFDLYSWNLSCGGRDAAWRDFYFGWIDHRMTVERPPQLFSGAGAVRLPPAWTLLIGLDGAGSRFAFHAVDTGALVYSEHIEVERLG